MNSDTMFCVASGSSQGDVIQTVEGCGNNAKFKFALPKGSTRPSHAHEQAAHQRHRVCFGFIEDEKRAVMGIDDECHALGAPSFVDTPSLADIVSSTPHVP